MKSSPVASLLGALGAWSVLTVLIAIPLALAWRVFRFVAGL